MILKSILDFMSEMGQRASSRKFLVLMLAVGLHLRNPAGFTGDNMVWVFAVYMGVNVVQKFADKMK